MLRFSGSSPLTKDRKSGTHLSFLRIHLGVCHREHSADVRNETGTTLFRQFPFNKGRKIGVQVSLLRMASECDTVSGSEVLEAGKRKEEGCTGTRYRYSHSISINVTSYDI